MIDLPSLDLELLLTHKAIEKMITDLDLLQIQVDNTREFLAKLYINQKKEGYKNERTNDSDRTQSVGQVATDVTPIGN